MKCRYSIRNFRVFDSEGYTFEINPITILTGCNSSGKSSLVKSIAVFSDWLNKVSDRVLDLRYDRLFNIPLDFSLDYLKLGGLSSSLNNSETDNSYICFSIDQYSDSLGENIVVDYYFTSRKNDLANNAWLSSLKITECDGTEIFSIKDNTYKCEVNLKPIKQKILKYLEWRSLRNDYIDKTPSSQYSKEIYKDSSRIKDFRAKISCKMDELYPKDPFDTFLSKKVQDKQMLIYSDDDFDHVTDALGHIQELLHKNPLLLHPEFFELDKIPKEQLLDFVENKCESAFIQRINTEDLEQGRKNSYNDRVINDKESALITLKWAVRIFQNSNVERFTEFLRLCEEQNGLETEGLGDILLYAKEFKDNFSSAVRKALVSERTLMPLEILKVLDKSWDGKVYKLSRNEKAAAIIDGPPPYFMILKALHFICMPEYSGWKDYQTLCFDLINEILENTIATSIVPIDLCNFIYLGTSQVQVNRLYHLGNNTDSFSKLLNTYIGTKATKQYGYQAGSFIKKWVTDLDIALKVSIKKASGDSGFQIYLRNQYHQDILLSDLGHGISQVLSILIAIEIAIMKGGRTLAIEEPEAHLHPKYQSLLASIFADAYKKHGVHFIIETHSEYMIRAFQKLIAYGPTDSDYGILQDDLSIYYFNDPRKERRPSNEAQIKKIEIADDGCLINPFGPGFFDEALNLSTDLLRIKIERNAKK